MRGGPEVLSWPGGDAAAGRVEDDGPVSTWVDLGDLRESGGGTGGADGTEPPHRPGPFQRVPKLTGWLVVLAAIAALVVPALRSPATPAPDTVTRTDASDVEQYPPWMPPPPTALPLPDRMALAARNSQPLRDAVRPGATRGDCPKPPGNAQAPVKTAMKAIDATLPGFHLVDSSRLRDTFGELCLLQLRARDAHGNVLVLNVVPPERWPGIHTQELQSLQSRHEGSSYTRTVSELTVTGWRVDLGAVGAQARLPDLGELGDIADDPTLTW
jgi:hypothetical protein